MKTNMNRFLLMILIHVALLVPVGTISAQNINTANLSWSIKRTDYVGTGQFDESGGTLISYGNTSVEWWDVQGALRKSFTIRETNGAWNNVAASGSILYEAESEGRPCTVTFLRDGSSLRATIIILPDNEQPIIYEFTLQNFITL